MIIKEKDQEAAFCYFLEESDDIESSGKSEADRYFTATEIQKLERESGKLVEGILTNLLERKMTPENFYGELWKKAIAKNSILELEKERIYALYRIWIDGRIPYFQLENDLKMTNEKYREVIEKNRVQIREAIFIMNSQFTQKTERSSLIVKVLDSCSTEEDKAVVLAQILNISERKVITKLLQGVKEKAEDRK